MDSHQHPPVEDERVIIGKNIPKILNGKVKGRTFGRQFKLFIFLIDQFSGF
jgi:hypothetical protein